MRFTFLVAIGAFSATVLSQSLNSLPQCAQNCVGNSLSTTGCSNLDIACICGSSTWISGLSCCITTACSPQDQNTTITFADQLCDTVGVKVPTSASCASTASSTPAPSSSAASNSTAAGNSTTTTAPNSASSGSTSHSTSASAQSSSSSTKASSSTSASASSNAGAHQEYGMELGMAAVGLLAALV